MVAKTRTEVRLTDVLGGPKTLGSRVRNTEDLAAKIREGLPTEALAAVMKAMMLSHEILARLLMITPRTLQRRKREKALPKAESDQLVRLARLYQRTVNTLGSHEDAVAWMHHPNITLGNKTPLELMDTVLGEERVLALLGRIEHGVYS